MLLKKKEKTTENGKLWTRNFTTLIIGSLVSFAGGNAVVMALGLLIFDITESPIYYAVFMAVGNAVGIFIPFIAAPMLEKIHKRKAIYTLDFITAAMFFIMAMLSRAGVQNGEIVLFCAVAFRIFNKVYEIAYHSLFPMVVDKSKYSKAYSVSSLITNLAEAAELFGTLGYRYLGIANVLFVCSVLFFTAAIFETKITYNETIVPIDKTKNRLKSVIEDYKIAFKFIKNKSGILELLIFYFINWTRHGAFWAMAIPFFKSVNTADYAINIFDYHWVLSGELLYTVVMSFFSTGQFYGGAVNYKLSVKRKNRIKLFTVVVTVEVLTMSFFAFYNIWTMFAAMFITAFCGIITNCLVQTVVYERVPQEMISRYTGCERAIFALGMAFGNMIGGTLLETISGKGAFFFTSVPTLLCLIVLLVTRNKQMRSVFGDYLTTDGK